MKKSLVAASVCAIDIIGKWTYCVFTTIMEKYEKYKERKKSEEESAESSEEPSASSSSSESSEEPSASSSSRPLEADEDSFEFSYENIGFKILEDSEEEVRYRHI